MSDETDDIQCDFLGFCGCGLPEENLHYIMVGLQRIDSLRDHSELTHEEWDKFFSNHKRQCLEHFGNESSEYFFYYWCAKEGITEHGVGLPGWLTEKGYTLLTRLQQMNQGRLQTNPITQKGTP